MSAPAGRQGRHAWKGARSILLGGSILLLIASGGGAAPHTSAHASATLSGLGPSTAPSDGSTNRTVAAGWSNVTPYLEGAGDSDASPPAPPGAAATFDPSVGATVTFGGTDSDGTVLNTTWLLVAGEYEWASLLGLAARGSPVSPPALTRSSVAPAPNGSVLLYGGTLPNGTSYGGTWEFAGNTWMNLTWTHLSTPESPPAAGEPLLASGGAGAGTVLYTGAATNSTWVCDHGAWSAMPARVEPPPRSGATMAYDAGRGADVLFGGHPPLAGSPWLDDTWLFGNQTWTQLSTPTIPPPLEGAALTYDAADGYDLLVGVHGTFQTWTLSSAGWQNVTDSTARGPAARLSPILVYDAWDQFVLMGAGSDIGSAPQAGDFWGWNFPASPVYSGLSVPALPAQLWIIVAIVAAVPVIVALLYYRRPRRKLPSDVPAPASPTPG